MSRLVDFYRDEATDGAGRRLQKMLAWPDDLWEDVHDFIQWLFPLPEPSNFNADAPLLTKEDIAAFQSDPLLRANVLASCKRFLAFLGLSLSDPGDVVESENFKARLPDIWAHPNHNWLRISRMLRSLTLLGMEPVAQAAYRYLDGIYRSKKYPISADTFGYWTKAVE